MPKHGFPMPTAKNRFQILNLHPKKTCIKKKRKKHGLKPKNYPFIYQNLGLELGKPVIKLHVQNTTVTIK